jgi:hypothetical protein
MQERIASAICSVDIMIALAKRSYNNRNFSAPLGFCARQ